MMPLAPTPIVAVPSKPKIGFSIDSIVGSNDGNKTSLSTHSSPVHSDGEHSISRSPSPVYNHNGDMMDDMHSDHNIRVNSSPESHRSRSASLSRSVSPTLDPGRSPPPIIRPSALQPGHMGGFNKGLYLQDHMVHPGHHLLAAAAAQHFQAAGLAAALNNGSFSHPPTSGAPNSGPPGPGLLPSSHHPSHPPPRDTYPLYPWLLSRHGRIFPHRFPGGKTTSNLFMNMEMKRMIDEIDHTCGWFWCQPQGMPNCARLYSG